MAIEPVHPISLYFIGRSGLVDAFSDLLKSYRTSTQYLNLPPAPKHIPLRNALNIGTELR
jgi:hypothetical protein